MNDVTVSRGEEGSRSCGKKNYSETFMGAPSHARVSFYKTIKPSVILKLFTITKQLLKSPM